MKKRVYRLLMLICFVMMLTVAFSVAVNAETAGKCGDNITWEISGTTLIISGEGEMYDYEPTPLLPITYVVPWSDERIKYVRFEGSITRIGNHAFDGCVVLESVIFDCKTIKEIGDYAFADCMSLKTLALEEGITTIGKNAFDNCGLNSITLPSSLEKIEKGAFGNTISLYEVNYNDIEEKWNKITIEEENECLFWDDVAINYYIGGKCGEDVFWSYLKGVITISGTGEMYDFTTTLQPWKEYAADTYGIDIEQGITRVGNYAFYGFEKLKRVSISDSVASIGRWAFTACYFLEEINLLNGLLTIEEYAFARCYSINNITIPTTVKDIKKGAFNSATGLEYVGYGSTKEAWELINIEDGNNYLLLAELITPDFGGFSQIATDSGEYTYWTLTSDGHLRISLCYQHKINADRYGYTYQIDCDTWQDYKDMIISVTVDSNIHTVYGLDNLKNLRHVNLGEIVNLYNGNFENCTSLETIVIPSTVNYIGSDFVSGCTNLKNIIVSPDNTNYTSVDGVLFTKDKTILMRCASGIIQTSYTVPDGVAKIMPYAFSDCSSLKNVTLPETLKIIDKGAFNDCTQLEKISLPENLVEIGSYVFSGCDKLTELKLPESLKSIGIHIIYGTNGINEITIPTGVETIDERAFEGSGLTTIHVDSGNSYYCSQDGVLFDKAMTKILCYPNCKTDISYEIPYGVTTVGAFSFYDCDNIQFITIPETVRTIGDYAFYNCSELVDVTTYTGVETIGDYAFEDCRNLIALELPKSLVSIGGGSSQFNKNLSIYYDGSREDWEKVEIPYNYDNVTIFYNYNYNYPVTGISLDKSVLNMDTEEWVDLTATVYPDNARYKRVIWKSSDERVATVSRNGRVQAKGLGKAQITAQDEFGDFVAACDVAVREYYDGFATEGSVLVHYKYSGGIVYIPETINGVTVTTMGKDLFADADLMYGVYVPENITKIEAGAFLGAESLEYVSYHGSSDQWNEIEIGDNNENLHNAELTCLGINEASLNVSGYYDGEFGGDIYIDGGADCYTVDISLIDIDDDGNETVSYELRTWWRNDEGLLTFSIPYEGDNQYHIVNVKIYNNDGTELLSELETERIYAEDMSAYEFYYYKGAGFYYGIEDNSAYIVRVAYYDSDMLVIPVKIGDYKVTKIADYALGNLVKPEEILIPDSVTKIGKGVLNGFVNNGKIYYTGTQNQWNEIDIDEDNSVLNSLSKFFDYTKNTVSCSWTECVASAEGVNITLYFDEVYRDAVIVANLKNETDGYTSIVKTMAFNLERGVDTAQVFIPIIPDEKNYIVEFEFVDSLTKLNRCGEYQSEMFCMEKPRYTSGNFIYLIEDDGSATICNYIGSAVELDIPVTLDRYAVKRIADNGLGGNQITKIINIGESIIKIGDFALHGFENLEEVNVDANNAVYSSQSGVLYSKAKDKLIYYPFKKTETEFVIPDTVKTIGMCAITLCESLNSIVIPNSVETIGDCAFMCNSVREFNIPASVKSIGLDVFYEDYPVIETINVNADNTVYCSIDGVVFSKDKTELVEYPRGRKDEFYAVPDGVEIISANFFNAAHLKTLFIPKSVSKFGEWANLFGLDKILYPGTEEEYCMINNCMYAQNMEFNYDDSEEIQGTLNSTYSDGKVSISVNFDKIEKECKMWVAVYDLKGNLVKIFDEDVDSGTSDQNINFNAGEEYIGYDVKVMFWEGDMIPVINPMQNKIK